MHEIKSSEIKSPSGEIIYRRDFTKKDGRGLSLYGYKPHTEVPLEEDFSEVAKGGELRWHPFRQEWNIYAAHRQNRTFKPSRADDPLAPSKRGSAPTEIPFTDFELAVFENKFTSLHIDAPTPPPIDGIKSERAAGRCEVVVYTPEPQGNLYTIGQTRRRLLIQAWIDRYHTLFEQGCKFVMPFENRGEAVGVTLHHPHGQIYGFPFIPTPQQKRLEAFEDGYDLAADIRRYEDGYAIASAGDMVAFCPPYARFPFEVWIAPRVRKAGPWALNATEIDGFAELLGEVTRRYDAYFKTDTDYMLNLQASPQGYRENYHFTAQFYPLLRAPGRVKYLASVEQSTGAFTVDVMPEFAVKTLRDMA